MNHVPYDHGQLPGYCLPCDTAAAARELRDAANVLEARIADQDAEIGQLRRRVTELEHRCNDRQAAHNRLASAHEALERRVEEIGRAFAACNVRMRS
jgi:chromosome segregation ATPase